MKKQIIWIGIIFLILSMLTISCKKKEHLSISKNAIVFTYAGGSDVFRIEADCDWTIERDVTQTWYSISKESGSGNDTIVINTAEHFGSFDRGALLTVVSSDRKHMKAIGVVQTKIAIAELIRKVWFTRTYQRWDTDYYNNIIVESYRDYTYYSNPGYENWFFYFFEDSTGYEIRTFEGDTIYYPCDFIFYPDGDSLYINFRMEDSTVVEDYHTTIQELNSEKFVFTNEYRPHQFERITTYNVTGDDGSKRSSFPINPKKVKRKTPGPLIEIKP